jgi:hypothetical protein
MSSAKLTRLRIEIPVLVTDTGHAPKQPIWIVFALDREQILVIRAPERLWSVGLIGIGFVEIGTAVGGVVAERFHEDTS